MSPHVVLDARGLTRDARTRSGLETRITDPQGTVVGTWALHDGGILRDGVPYRDLGPDHFDRLQRGKVLRRLVRKIEDLGYDVEVTRAA